MIKNYKDFINEEVFNDILKKTSSVLNKDSSQNLINFVKKLDTTNDIKKSLPIIKGELKQINDDFNKFLTDATNVTDIQNRLKDNFIMIYDILNKLFDKYKMNELKPNILYKQSNNKILQTIFVRTDLKDFQGNLEINMKSLINELSKGTGLEIKNENYLYEADAQNIENNVVNTDQIDNKQEEQKMIKFKENAKNFVNNMISGLNKKLEEVINKSNVSLSNEKEVEDVAKSMSGSKNLESNKMFINAIKGITDTKILDKIKDVLVNNNVITKEDSIKMKF